MHRLRLQVLSRVNVQAEGSRAYNCTVEMLRCRYNLPVPMGCVSNHRRVQYSTYQMKNIQPQSAPPPFCIHCRHFKASENEYSHPHLCEHPMFSRNIDLVTGAPAYPPCSILRQDAEPGQQPTPCGTQGRLFEPRIGTVKSALASGGISTILDETGKLASGN